MRTSGKDRWRWREVIFVWFVCLTTSISIITCEPTSANTSNSTTTTTSPTNRSSKYYYSEDESTEARQDETSLLNVAVRNESLLNSLLKSPDQVKKKRQAIDLVKKDFFNVLESAQLKLSEKDLVCMPGSVFYNGTCIFISSKRQKLSWIHAERFCRKLPLNTSFLLFENNHKFDFIRNEMIKLRERENPIDQLVFYVGFRYQNNEWKWVNNQSLTRTNLTLGKYWWDWSGSHGDCGSIALLKNNEMIMRSAPCLSTSNRFICEYNLNPCYKNDICGPRGRCVNLYYRFYCDCTVSLFFEGQYCDKLNSAGIQAIIGLVLVGFLILGIICNSSRFNKQWESCFGKDPKPATAAAAGDPESGGVEFADGKKATKAAKREKSATFRSVSLQLKRTLSHVMRKFYARDIPYVILAVLTLTLASVQIVFTHNFIQIEFIRASKKSKFVKDTCQYLNDYYMFEDLIYLPFSLAFLLFLFIFMQSRRFNKYIMVKYKNYFKSWIFNEVQNRYLQEYEKQKKIKENQLKEKTCGQCRYMSYRCFTQKFCSVFCCIFCCSCCVPPGSNTRCFIWYCCCLGWRQTDFYKVLSTIWTIVKGVFYYGLGCPVWKLLWRVTKERRAQREKRHRARARQQQQQQQQQQRNAATNITLSQPSTVSLSSNAKRSNFGGNDGDDESYDIDIDDDFDVDDYDIETQNLNRGVCPFPSTPFSTSNRAQSAAVYIIYTYDVLNIFMFVFTGSFMSTNLPFLGQVSRASGILVELVIQFLQVIMIGVKFYPILVVADADPNVFIYGVSALYMLFIWLSWFFKKALCARSEAFIKQAFKQAGHEISNRIKTSIGTKLNISNTFLGLFTDVDLPSETYLSALREKIPKTFKDYFGRYNPSDHSEMSNDDLLLYNTLNGGGGPGSLADTESSSLLLNNYYLMNNAIDPSLVSSYTTSSVSTSTVSMMVSESTGGFRSKLKNKTMGQLGILSTYFYQRDEDFYNLVNVLENLPLYLTLSYLLIRYSMLFVSSFVDWIRDQWRFKANYDLGKNFSRRRVNDPQRLLTEVEVKESIALCDLMIKDLDEGYKEKNKLTNTTSAELDDMGEPIIKKNHNYCYIRNLFGDLNLYGQPAVRDDSFRNTIKESLIYNFIQTHIYRNIPYMKFSKQFINTYTVAFMVVYFFTLFGLRLSNIFGNALVGGIEILYKFLLGGLIPTIDMDSHNFNAEFRITCILTSIIIFSQLLSSIKTFHEDLLRLNKGEKFFTSFVFRYKDEEYSKVIKKRNKESLTIASDSLHFPGYLIAHLVYGYVLLFLAVFFVVVVFKIFYYLPGAMQASINLLLPIFILFTFKFVSIKYLVRTIFLRRDQQRITNLAPYYVISYFNFFFDCFLGLLACASRIWQTTIISMIRLPRLDKSMFNREDDLLMRRLDKGHLAYLNYVRMEHWYNNPILNGFCEMLLESMFYSQIYREKFNFMTYSPSKFMRQNSSLSQLNSPIDPRTPDRLLSLNSYLINQQQQQQQTDYTDLDFNPDRPNMLGRTTSLDPNKINRRVNFELESRQQQRRLTRNNSLNVPSTSEYLREQTQMKGKKQKIMFSRRGEASKPPSVKKLLSTHSEVIDEEDEDRIVLDEEEEEESKPKQTRSELLDDDEDDNNDNQTASSDDGNNNKSSTMMKKTRSEIIDDDEYDENVNDYDNPNEAPVYQNDKNNEYDDDDEDEDDDENLMNTDAAPTSGLRGRNENFEYKSFLRLRNIIFLALMLRKNPSLRKYRFHYLLEMKRRAESRKSRVQSTSELFNEMFNQRYEKIKQKLTWKLGFFKGSSGSSGTSSTDTTNNDYDDDDDDVYMPAAPSNNNNNNNSRSNANTNNNPSAAKNGSPTTSSRVRTSSL